ncbi:cytochrome P450 2C30-like isoform X2 [Paramacrobiotus metropolitanus]|uniref:cytochrome P450 2C30-like isoform X2 n=1 Tax=Paramacrobiotus metropolitanus TaxID=2943436 RepID=UPI0024457180|nr:cytochrome P450 2C30-like isoform X2 [Paramacrobiotus metropolitanus]XP_055348081.1 cytochrome P450 2C30-like isoform X2 [Paramacrobiotus metropolitanus]
MSSEFHEKLSMPDIFSYFKRRKRIPPGPLGLPVVGYSPFLGRKPAEKIVELSKQYGNIMSFYLGNRLTVILNDYDAVKAAYIDNAEAFTDRQPGFAHRVISGSENGPLNGGTDVRVRGLTMANGEQWRQTRRFALTTLRNLGMGKSRLESRILEEVDYICTSIRRTQSRPLEPNDLMYAGVANIMFAVCLDKRFDHNDPQFKMAQDFVLIALPTISNTGALQLFPWLRHVPGKFKRFWSVFQFEVRRFRGILKEHLKLHDNDRKDDEEVQDYVDAFRVQQKKEVEQGHQPNYFDDDELLVHINNFFGAGSETTASTICWALYFLVRHPEVRHKVQEEIDSTVGHDRPVTMEDKTNLKYVEAFCAEVARWGSVVPLSVARGVSQDVTIDGYFIPKGTYVMPNLWYIHRDPKYWGSDIGEFKPERFLDEQGRVTNPPAFMPFSIGKRSCLGESLAKMEIFLFITNIVQQFTVTLEAGYTLPPPGEYACGLTTRPPKFRVIFESRR